MTKKIVHVVGARPNFMKASPVWKALARTSGLEQMLVHTGQHYDAAMSDVFFQELELPVPDINLNVGSGSHAVQTAQVMTRFEEVVLEERPDLVVLYGDVNSTAGAALVCAKQLVPMAHVEAGLRSFDRRMPEEINRVLVDQLADILLTPSQDGDENLIHEGIEPAKIHLVGNVMIDTLTRWLPRARARRRQTGHVLVTLHRPATVDCPRILSSVMAVLGELSSQLPVVFPVHPRTRQQLEKLGLGPTENLQILGPLGYLDFLALESGARLVITDSGGIQEETTWLGVPCLTFRENTERPVTLTLGTNTLVGLDATVLRRAAREIIAGHVKIGRVPPLWDGHAAERVAQVLSQVLDGRRPAPCVPRWRGAASAARQLLPAGVAQS